MALRIGNKEISNRAIVKETLGLIFGVSVGFVVKQIIDNTTDEPESRYEAGKQYLGAVAIGMVAKEAVGNTIDRRVDAVFDAFKDAKIDAELKSITEEGIKEGE